MHNGIRGQSIGRNTKVNSGCRPSRTAEEKKITNKKKTKEDYEKRA
jgi:hypothetical protein